MNARLPKFALIILTLGTILFYLTWPFLSMAEEMPTSTPVPPCTPTVIPYPAPTGDPGPYPGPTTETPTATATAQVTATLSHILYLPLVMKNYAPSTSIYPPLHFPLLLSSGG